jgi:hypothetical protein
MINPTTVPSFDIDPIARGVQGKTIKQIIADEDAPMRSPKNLCDPLRKTLEVDGNERVDFRGYGIPDVIPSLQLSPRHYGISLMIKGPRAFATKTGKRFQRAIAN